MPRVVDHNAYRVELATRAIGVFRQFGCHGLGMRQIADELGVSKSSLYHYFAGKQELFEQCSQIVTAVPTPDLPVEATPDDRFAALVVFAEASDTDFLGELSLLIDYVRPLSRNEVRDDEGLGRATTSLEQAIAHIVGGDNARAALQ